MFKTLSNIYQKIGATVIIMMTMVVVFFGVSALYFLYTEYINPPKASIPQERIDSYVAKLNAEAEARMKAEKEQLNKKYHKN